MRKFGFGVLIQSGGGKILNTHAQGFFVDKFRGDKILYEDSEYSIILDGVILNKKSLLAKYNQEDWVEVIKQMYIKSGDRFFNEMRGSFAGVLYSKKEEKILLFSDQIGSKFVYYTNVGNVFFASTMMDEVYSFRKERGAKVQLSIDNAYLLLSYGFMIDDRTLCDDIKKIKPGYYLKMQGGRLEEKQYYLIDNTPDRSLTEDDYIELIDEKFRNAVKEQFEKDREYNYKHIVALSGGLDSRMTCWVAHEMGYTEQLNYTFSQTDYYDETVPKRIAGDLKHEWLFKALDNGLWLYNLEDITELTGGNVLYYGLSHSYSMYSKFNFEEYGMIHTGQLGDVVLGTWYSSKDEKTQFQWGDGAYSKTMLERIRNLEYSEYSNQEIAKFYLRGFPGTNNGNMAEYAYTESFSPFYNLDFLRLALTIPVEMRFHHGIYKKWILAKYPKAADYVWEKIGCKLNRRIGVITIGDKMVSIEHLPVKVLRKLSPSFSKKDKHDMNPLAFYMETNKDLSDFFRKYDKYVDAISDSNLKEDVLRLANSQSGVERIQAVSLLCAIKQFFS